MNAIYDSAVRSYEAAAQVLMTLQDRRTVLSAEAAQRLEGRPKLVLAAGYTDLAPGFGICIPEDTRAEILPAREDGTFHIRSSAIDWMTFEAMVPDRAACRCYVDADVVFPVATIADVFLRDVTHFGAIRDSGHRTWRLGGDRGALCQLALPDAPEDVANRRIVIYLRQPPQRFALRSLAMTLI